MLPATATSACQCQCSPPLCRSAYGACPIFLGDCASPASFWDDGGDDPLTPYLSNLGVNGTNVVNADCDNCTPHTVFKVVGGSPASVHFAEGQLHYSCGDIPGLCVSGGTEGQPTPPCDPTEPVLAQQVQVEPCATAGQWQRVVAPM